VSITMVSSLVDVTDGAAEVLVVSHIVVKGCLMATLVIHPP